MPPDGCGPNTQSPNYTDGYTGQIHLPECASFNVCMEKAESNSIPLLPLEKWMSYVDALSVCFVHSCRLIALKINPSPLNTFRLHKVRWYLACSTIPAREAYTGLPRACGMLSIAAVTIDASFRASSSGIKTSVRPRVSFNNVSQTDYIHSLTALPPSVEHAAPAHSSILVECHLQHSRSHGQRALSPGPFTVFA